MVLWKTGTKQAVVECSTRELITYQGIPAKINPHNTSRLISDSEIDTLLGLLGGVPSVN